MWSRRKSWRRTTVKVNLLEAVWSLTIMALSTDRTSMALVYAIMQIKKCIPKNGGGVAWKVVKKSLNAEYQPNDKISFAGRV